MNGIAPFVELSKTVEPWDGISHAPHFKRLGNYGGLAGEFCCRDGPTAMFAPLLFEVHCLLMRWGNVWAQNHVASILKMKDNQP